MSIPAQLHISGYAALFGKEDLTGDVIRPGAFSRQNVQKLILTPISHVKMLYQHTAEKPIGHWHQLREDQNGLFAQGTLFTDTQTGRDVYHLIKNGVLDGLSIGFKPRKFRRLKNGKREISDISLWEISIVTFPMMPDARITRLNEMPARLPKNLLHAERD